MLIAVLIRLAVGHPPAWPSPIVGEDEASRRLKFREILQIAEGFRVSCKLQRDFWQARLPIAASFCVGC
jgi:hypothetical protein